MDGYIHGFNIIDVWNYQYFDFPLNNAMVTQQIIAVNSLIWPIDEAIYYIGTYVAAGASINDANRVHGFQKSTGVWQTVSPTYASSTLLVIQYRAAGALTYDSNISPNRIYYRTILGGLAYYEVINIVTYNYNDCSNANYNLHSQNLTIVGQLAIHTNGTETRIYYVGHYNLSGVENYYIHCLINDGTAVWSTVSPTFSAALYNGQPTIIQFQSDLLGCIAVSPDGNTIAYFGKAPNSYILYFKYIDGVNYAYHTVSLTTDVINSLQFTSDIDMYCISGNNVKYIKYEEAFGENPYTDFA